MYPLYCMYWITVHLRKIYHHVRMKYINSICTCKGIYREEGMQLTMYPTYSSDFVSETGYAKNKIQYTDVNKWAVLFTEL